MAKEDRPNEKRAKEIAEPIRVMLAEILKRELKGKEAKERMAKELGIKPGTLGSLVYSSKGGFDVMIASLVVAMNLKPEFFDDLKTKIIDAIMRAKPVSDLDRRWHALDESFDKEEKARWLTLIETYIRISPPKTRK